MRGYDFARLEAYSSARDALGMANHLICIAPLIVVPARELEQVSVDDLCHR
jgi:hypothetical protein